MTFGFLNALIKFLTAVALLIKSGLAQSDASFPLKISVDLARLFPIKHDYENGEVMYDRLVLTIIPAVVKHIEETFESYDVEKIQVNDTPCEKLNITSYANTELKSNFHIVFNFEDTDTGYTAYAGVCKVDEANKRPVMAFVYINVRNNVLDDKSFNEQVFTTLLHELHHGLGFLSSYIPYFWDRGVKKYRPQSEVFSSSQSYRVRIKRPELVSWVSNHFNCPYPQVNGYGAPLENLGGDESQDSHFEASIFGNEALNPSAFYNLQYTGATIAYIESMGYFKVQEPKTKMAEILFWGYKKGCGVLQDNLRCEDIPMVCQKSGTQCSEDYYSVGQCSLDHVNPSNQNKAINSCSVFKERLDCRYQSKLGSRCVEFLQEGVSRNATCGDIECTRRAGNQELYDVVMKFKEFSVACTAEEVGTFKTPSGSQDKVTCPNTLNICRLGAKCPNDCTNNGRCKMDGKCWCFPDFTGDDCSKINPTPYRMMVLDWSAKTLSLMPVVYFLISYAALR